jgi:hypothetical protein
VKGMPRPGGGIRNISNIATILMPTPVDHPAVDRESSHSVLDLIGVTAPYVRLSAFGVRKRSY